MLIYVCDGSHSGGEMGAGIVRVDRNDITQYHFSKKCKLHANIHELFAISKTLEIIEENRDLNCCIYNDCKMTVPALQFFNYQSKNPNKGKLLPIYQKIKKLESKGFTIVIKHTSELKNQNYLNIAHHLSRLYMNKRIIKGTVELTEIAKGPLPIPLSKYPNIPQQFGNDAIFKKNCHLYSSMKDLQNKHGLLIKSEHFKLPNRLLFLKLSKKTWVAFGKNLTPIYSGNIIEVSYHIFKMFSEQNHKDETLHINEQFVHSFLSFCQSSPIITKPDLIKIEFVLSFIHNGFSHLYKDIALQN